MSFKLKLHDKSKIYFTSDWHLYHKNILKYDKRPFLTIHEMNKTIIENHRVLDKDDHLFYLGDLTFKMSDDLDNMLRSLSCHKYFIYGNHDQLVSHSYLSKYFDRIYDGYCELGIREQLIVMSHYPMFEWNKGHRGSWHLFGHTHGNDKNNPNIGKRKTMNVGVMLNDYKPFSYLDIEEKMNKMENISHH